MGDSTKKDDDAYLRSCYTYTNLFNLEHLANFRLPGAGDDAGSSTSGSLDGNEHTKSGQRRDLIDGGRSEVSSKRKRTPAEVEARCNLSMKNDEESNGEVLRITENDYRVMIGEHLKKLRKSQLKDAIVARLTFSTNRKTSYCGSRAVAPKIVPSYRKPSKEQTESNGDSWLDGKHNADLLDLGEGILMEIPPFYDVLAPFLHLPDFGSIQIDERILSGHLKSGSIVSMVASDPLAKVWKAQAGRHSSEKSPLDANNLRDTRVSQRKFPLQVIDQMPSLSNASIPSRLQKEGSEYASDTPDSSMLATQQVSPITWRHLLSENGTLMQCEVKIIERCDGYEVIERRVPNKESLKRDPAVVAKEDTEKIGKYWVNLVRKDLIKHHKNFFSFHRKQLQDAKKYSECCQREVKYRGTRSLKVMKAAPIRIRKLARDMVIFWKKADKEQAELRKKEEREAAEALKREEELREARRQQQRLNFLLTQTELYSHFMQNKMSGFLSLPVAPSYLAGTGEFDEVGRTSKAGSDPDAIAEDATEEAALKNEALRAAQYAVSRQRKQTDAFDNECFKLRQAAGFDGKQKLVDNVEEMDLLNPSSMPVTSTVQQPTCFHGYLKEYQLKGLQWLVNCYEQGLNGILADEMGLGKTIQAMAFLAHLAEEKNIWGPFLVVAPASVLNNWADEVHRFCPDLKILPYWGGIQERTVLRKNISPKHLYRRDAVFHILITSYQLLVADEKYLRRVKWQYMVLDEAQAIKSASSIRWKTLLSFNCRNRLLLTGTPIQNNMAELWALLHFIMPTLFDSHEQFNEWFSKGIESHAEHGGTLNEHQLNRLHSILKPFMLRRVKKDVITEMTNKKEIVIPCTLSSRQQDFYQAIKNKISVTDLFDSNGAHLNEKKVLNLMNIVIQLRKVCNHPELFERNDGHTFVQFAATMNPLNPPAFGELDYIHYAGGRNPISFKVPKLVYREGMKCLPTAASGSLQGFEDKWINNLLCVFSPGNVYTSIFPTGNRPLLHQSDRSGGFGFIRLIDLSPSETGFLAKASVLEHLLFFIKQWKTLSLEKMLQEELDYMDEQKVRAISRMLILPMHSELSCLRSKFPIGPCNEPYQALVISHEERSMRNISLLRSVSNFMSAVRAPQIEVICSDRGFSYQREEELENPWMKRLLLGFARTSEFNGPAMPGKAHYLIQEQDMQISVQQPLLSVPHRIFGSAPPLQSFDFAKMLTDSGKLQTLDILLKRLRSENHRVLLFAQMTKMLNILEDYMNYRKYKYLRLDGSSTIMDRRDMVKDFQLRPDIFLFLLSTRAGGLGINLTAADTVIFYESDWNPTMDLQAMDRAHRLGQTKEVTVYRLICKGTIEEKIVKRANQKNTVQQLVMTGGHSQGDALEAEEVVSLLLDDIELEQRMKEQVSKQSEKVEKRKKGWGVPTAGLKTIRLDSEWGASLEEEKNGETAFDVTDENAMKCIETGGPNSKQRLVKRKNDGAGKPPKPPKVPKSVTDCKSNKVSNDHRAPQERRDPNLSNVRERSCNSALASHTTNDNQESTQIQQNRSDYLTSDHSTQSGGSLTQFTEEDLLTSREFMENNASILSWPITDRESSFQRTDNLECKVVQAPIRHARNETPNNVDRVEMEHFNVMQTLCNHDLSSKDYLYYV